VDEAGAAPDIADKQVVNDILFFKVFTSKVNFI